MKKRWVKTLMQHAGVRNHANPPGTSTQQRAGFEANRFVKGSGVSATHAAETNAWSFREEVLGVRPHARSALDHMTCESVERVRGKEMCLVGTLTFVRPVLHGHNMQQLRELLRPDVYAEGGARLWVVGYDNFVSLQDRGRPA